MQDYQIHLEDLRKKASEAANIQVAAPVIGRGQIVARSWHRLSSVSSSPERQASSQCFQPVPESAIYGAGFFWRDSPRGDVGQYSALKHCDLVLNVTAQFELSAPRHRHLLPPLSCCACLSPLVAA